MEPIDEATRRLIERRKHMHRALAELDCILDSYVGEPDDFAKMELQIDEFREWLTEQSPIAL